MSFRSFTVVKMHESRQTLIVIFPDGRTSVHTSPLIVRRDSGKVLLQRFEKALCVVLRDMGDTAEGFCWPNNSEVGGSKSEYIP